MCITERGKQRIQESCPTTFVSHARTHTFAINISSCIEPQYSIMHSCFLSSVLYYTRMSIGSILHPMNLEEPKVSAHQRTDSITTSASMWNLRVVIKAGAANVPPAGGYWALVHSSIKKSGQRTAPKQNSLQLSQWNVTCMQLLYNTAIPA